MCLNFIVTVLATHKKILGNFLLLPHANAKWKGHVFCKNRDENTCRGWASFNRLREIELRALQQWKKVACQNSQGNTETVSEFIISVSWVG